MEEIQRGTYKDIFEQLDTMALITNEHGNIITANTIYFTMSGFSREEVINKKIESFIIGNYHPEKSSQSEVFVKTKDKSEILQWLIVNPVYFNRNSDSLCIWLLTDFQVSGYDPLTKLPNRFLLHQELNKAILTARKNHSIFAVLFLDLDRFKFVNDTLGHSYGDILLQEAALRIKHAIGNHNMMARMGGDEFVCVLDDVEDEKGAEQYAKKIIAEFAKTFVLKETDIYITTSIGISMFPFDGDDVESLVTNADTAMYRAKKKGRNQYEKAKADISAGSFEKLLIENSLRKALEKDELLLYYQPQVNLKTNSVTSVEVLLRWEHPDLGMISPGEFIPIAEETGLILPIGEWVLRKACQTMNDWQKAGHPPVRVAINLSARQFLQHDLVDQIKMILSETSLEPNLLELEITENMVMHDVHKAIGVLHQLKDLGVTISIDDFGTGYSSLNYLKEFPIDTLKIDRSFIYDIDKNSNSVALTKAITTLAHDLNLNVVAEGVENYKQLSLVKQFSCDFVQGFYFSKPLSYDHITDFLLNQKNTIRKNA
ncbi:EAL domain-containing protein [Bacillus dakarensis]|uniref:sensor domain-containing protein n=1 Tax=Robertmurraya dakarensis TaxID=1926278 RepID=UPI001F3A1CB7|nr:EAL domain-containing protein [Bacillus dakarensis]